MKKLILAAALLSPALALADATPYKIDGAHTHSSFTVRHLVISNVRGEFAKTEGVVAIDDADLAKSKVEATIDVASIDTREPKRDEHLKSADFFDTAKFPTMTFKSTKVEKAGEGKLKVTGNLTLKGVTKPVVLDVLGPTKEIKDPWGNVKRGISASTKINRKEFGMTWGGVIEAGPVVGDEVAIEIEAELTKDVPAKK
ncbi:MAG TPA: YceI family protein [Anaeromyxobacteraceae bacterium]|nr:YceI family protein [Anaeromyxobacteraceae bacterium]